MEVIVIICVIVGATLGASTLIYLILLSPRRLLIKKLLSQQFVCVFVAPAILYPAIFFAFVKIAQRPSNYLINLSDISLFLLLLLSLVAALAGNIIHGFSKSGDEILYHYGSEDKFIDFCHGPLSHYTIYIASLLAMLFLVLLEVNHPLPFNLTQTEVCLLVASGVVSGLCFGFASIYSGHWKNLSFMIALIILIDFLIIYLFSLNLAHLPIVMFTNSAYLTAIFCYFVFVIKKGQKNNFLKRG